MRNNKPSYTLEHIVKERYPTFVDAVRDMDDALSMCSLFSTFPRSGRCHVSSVQLCRRLTVEFMHYVIAARALRKVFLSIKGIYYQAEIQGQEITWVVPYMFSRNHATDVDYRVMVTFNDFYATLLGFINFRLYQSLNLTYPPKMEVLDNEVGSEVDYALENEELMERLAGLSGDVAHVVAADAGNEEAELDEFPVDGDNEGTEGTKRKEEAQRLQNLQNLFVGLKFFLNREVPREPLAFIIRSFGGMVSWEPTVCIGATFGVSDETVTHQVVDRPMVERTFINRTYVQPQWLFDCVNACMLLPTADYLPGAHLPPHVSPFMKEGQGEYEPPEQLRLRALQRGEQIDQSDVEKTMEKEEEETDGEQVDSEDDGRGSDSGHEEMEEEEKEEEIKLQEIEKKMQKKVRGKLFGFCFFFLNHSTIPLFLESDSVFELFVFHVQRKVHVTAGKVKEQNEELVAAEEALEEKRLAVMAMRKKDRHLYSKIMYGRRKKEREANKLAVKRKAYEDTLKAAKKVKKR
uniref:Pescadillo n=1 Tax=Eptatretus burgeri TaxID=7764 RepID=A0A8C4QJD9_EPTBU